MTTYPDRFRNALRYSHQVTVRGELWYDGVKVDDLTFVSGSVSADRRSTVRRTLTANIDPAKAPVSMSSAMAPYGSIIKVWRGIRYPDGTVEDYPIFTGRIDEVQFSRTQVSVRASDMAIAIVDARFIGSRKATRGSTIVANMQDIILEAIPDAVIDVTTTATDTVVTPAAWDRERNEALDGLAKSIGAEWFAGPDGHFHIDPLPALNDRPADWVVDAGEAGVMVDRRNVLDRTGVYNMVEVISEPPDGQEQWSAEVGDWEPTSPTYAYGPFGFVPRFFVSQFISTYDQAEATAWAMLADVVALSKGVTVTCIANPAIYGQNVVYVGNTSTNDWDGMYFLESFTIPLDPESPMTMTLSSTMELDPEAKILRRVRVPRFAEGIIWP